LYLIALLLENITSTMERNVRERDFSLKVSMIEGAIASFAGAIIHQGFFLQAFGIFLGLPDYWFSILPNLQFIFSFLGIFAGYYLAKFGERKKIAFVTGIIYRGIWFLPAIFVLIFGKSSITVTVFVVSALVSFLFFRILMVVWMRWMDLLVFEETKGTYMGIRKAVTTFTLLLGFLLGGFLIKYFSSQGQENVAFFILFSIVGVVGFISSGLYLLQFDEKTKTRNISFIDFLRESFSILSKAKVRSIVWFFFFFEMVSSIGVPFIPVQVMKNFGLGPEFVSIQFSIYAVSMTLSSYFWGVLLDKFGAKSVLSLSVAGLCFTISLWFFVPRDLWFILTFFEPFVSGIFSAGYESSFVYIMFSDIHSRHKDNFFSVISAINGFGILIGTVLASAISIALSGFKVFILYKDFTLYELLFGITLVGRVSALLFFIPSVRYKRNVEKGIDLLKYIVFKLSNFFRT
jgi:MFS family permease